MTETSPAPETRPAPAETRERQARPHRDVHEVRFTTYPKLLFVWPIILAGLLFWPFARPATGPAPDATPAAVTTQPAADEGENAVATGTWSPPVSPWLGYLGWAYIWIVVFVLLTLSVDIDRNFAAFWLVVLALFWVLGLWLKDSHGWTFFGDIYAWFSSLQIQYNRNLGLALSIILLVPYIVMLAWARLNDRWRITHNEFEHYSLGRMDDSLGRGAKTIRTSFPDVFEMVLGLAGTLVVYNATGARELRRIPHVMFLPLIRRKLNVILEKTAITAAQIEDSEEDDEDM